MANTQSQAQQIKDLIIERMEAYDPTLNTGEGSAFYTQVVDPVFAKLSVDPFDTNIEEFLLTRLRQEFPSIPAESGDAIVDLLIRPLQLLLESFKRELQIIRSGQSLTDVDTMRLEDAEDLAANFFVSRRTGSRASGVVRVYFRQPTFVSILLSSYFSSRDGLVFYPNVPQFYRPETVAVQRSGDYYYVDVTVIAEAEGDEYNLPPGSITSVSGVSSAFRVTNLYEIGGGSAEETAEQLITRTRSSLTERSLVTRRGVRARLFDEFPTIRNMEVVGYGDPEMQRDRVEGSGGMDNLCSGMCFIVGRYAFLISMFENRGPDADHFLEDGGILDLNFWKFLYDAPADKALQRYTVESVVYNSHGDIESIPTVYIVKLDAAPDMEVPPISGLPGVLPGVFFTAYKKSTLTISGIPGGITNPDTDAGEILIEDGAVHIGGHYDVYIRPSDSSTSTTGMQIQRGEVALYEGNTLVTSGEVPSSVLTENGALKNKVSARLRLYFTPTFGTLGEGEVIQKWAGGVAEEDTSAYLLDLDLSENYCDLACLTSDTEWLEGDVLIGLTSGAYATITKVEQVTWSDYGVTAGMTLNIVNGPDRGYYKILDVRGVELILDLEMTVLGSGYRFRITDESVVDIFSPKSQIYPFGDNTANDLDTVIGTATVRVSVDLSVYGVERGDTLEILAGANRGIYTIVDFDSVLGPKAPVLDRVLRATDSSLEYVIYRPGVPLSSPLVRIAPGGIKSIDTSGQTTGFSIPPSESVGARAYQAFSGAKASYLGLNGFVLPDPGPTWLPTGDVVVDVDALDSSGQLPYIQQYWGEPSDCYSRDCKDRDDAFIAVVSITDQPTSSGGSDIRVHVDAALPTEALTFMQQLREWLVSVVESFELGDDFRSFIDLFAPITFEAPDLTVVNIIAQYEILIPKEIFDGCNNVFVAIPEHNWDHEFDENTSFITAMQKYNDGELRGGLPALSKAESGGNLTLLSGANAGSYVINKVYRYSLVNGGSIQSSDPDTTTDDYIDKNKMFEIVLVCIDDSFPVEPFRGAAEFFSSPNPTALTLPTPPSFNVQSTVRTGADAGTVLGPWEVVQQAVGWLFQFLNSAGFDLPEEFVVTPDSVLKKLTKTLFCDYVVGNTTCEQIVRMSFLEPTSVTAYGNRPCSSYEWHETDTTPGSILGDGILLPIAEIENLPLTLIITGIGTKETVEKTITTEIAEATDPDTFVSLLQDLIDPDLEKIVVSGLSDGGAALRLQLSTKNEGQDVSIRVEADSVETAARHLGFATSTDFTVATIPPDPTTDAFAVDVSKGATELGIRFRYCFQYLVFNGSLTSIGSPAVGDTVTSPSAGNSATIVGIIHGSSGTILLLSHPTPTTLITLIPAGSVYFNGDSATTYTAALSLTDINSEKIIDITTSGWVDGTDGITATVSSDGATTYSYSSFALPEVEDAEAWEAGLGTDFNSALSSALTNSILDSILGHLNTTDGSIFSTYFPSYTFANPGDVEFLIIDNGFGLSASPVVRSEGDTAVDGLYVQWDYKLGTGVSSGYFGDYGEIFGYAFYVYGSGNQKVNFSVEAGQHLSADPVSGSEYADDETYLFDDYSVVIRDVTPTDTVSIVPATAAEIDALSGDTVEAVGQALNLRSELDDGDGLRMYQFYVPLAEDGTYETAVDGNAYLAVRELQSLDSNEIDAFTYSGTFDAVTIETYSVGTSSVGESHTEFLHPNAPTLFSGTAGAAELLYVATASEQPFQVFPGERTGGRTALVDLYRDISMSSHVENSTMFEARFSDAALASPLLAGVRRGRDILRVYEQRTCIAVAGSGAEVLPEKFDRVVAVTTTYGSAVIQLPSLSTGAAEFSFLSASSTLEQDEVTPGDILFIEEGDDKGGYTVVSVSDTEIVLDRSLTTTTVQIYKAGNNGVIDSSTTLVDNEGPFTADDVGRYLTIFLSNYEGVDGSYQITSFLSSQEVEVDIPSGSFPISETGIHWAVTKAPIDELEDSEIAGATALNGLVPIRIYNHIPTEWRIATFHPSVSREQSNIECSYTDAAYRADNPHTRDLTLGPIRGYKQPYEIVRDGVVHISSTAMKSQGRDNGLYYFDVRAKSLGGDSVFNIPADTSLVSVFGTYDSDGYRLEVDDPLMSFSTREANTKLYFSPRYLPADLNDVEDNKVTIEGLSINVEHESSPLVSGVQTLLLSPANRVLCADPLARHFLPSYVYFDVAAAGGTTVMGQAIADYIDALEPEQTLDISVFEGLLHRYEVTSYQHPLTLQIVTHDLDRKPVLTRSHDTIGSEADEADFNGTHRTTYYIPGDVYTTSEETDIPDGERIYIKKRNT